MPFVSNVFVSDGVGSTPFSTGAFGDSEPILTYEALRYLFGVIFGDEGLLSSSSTVGVIAL